MIDQMTQKLTTMNHCSAFVKDPEMTNVKQF